MSDKRIKFIVRNMQVSDCADVSKIMAQVGFRNNIYNNEIYLKIDPGGIYVAQDTNSGKVLGACSGVNLSPDLAFIGQYVVIPEYQGLGIGSALWEGWKEHVGPHRNIALLASGNMISKYRDRCNFVVDPNMTQVYFDGKPNCNVLIEAIDGISVVPINENNIEKVIQYDKQVCDGLDRSRFIQEISQIDKIANAVALSRTNDVLGYCVVCPTTVNTRVVGPLYANDERIAELLLRKCCESLNISQTKEDIIIVFWSSNTQAISMVKKLGLVQFLESSLILTKKPINANLSKMFAVASGTFFPF